MAKLSKRIVNNPWDGKHLNKEEEKDPMKFEPLNEAVKLWSEKLKELSGWFAHSEIKKKLSEATYRPFTWRDRKKLLEYLENNEVGVALKTKARERSNTRYYVKRPLEERKKKYKNQLDEKYKNIIDRAFEVGKKPSVCVATIKYMTGNKELREISEEYGVSGAAIRDSKDFVRNQFDD